MFGRRYNSDAMMLASLGLWGAYRSRDYLSPDFIGPVTQDQLRKRLASIAREHSHYMRKFGEAVNVAARLSVFDEVFGSWPRQVRRQTKGMSAEDRYKFYLERFDSYTPKPHQKRSVSDQKHGFLAVNGGDII